MNKYFLLCFTLIISQVHAANNNYWQCIAADANYNRWAANHDFHRAAATLALEACKKQSPLPKSCNMQEKNCDHIVNGRSSLPMWRCTAFDQMAKAWISKQTFRERDDAAIASKNLCQNHSGMPESCYVNLLTCKNLNSRVLYS